MTPQRSGLPTSNSITTLSVCLVDQEILQLALAGKMKDYEDAVQVAAALSVQLDAVITRNSTDYVQSALPVFSPPDFLKQLSTQ